MNAAGLEPTAAVGDPIGYPVGLEPTAAVGDPRVEAAAAAAAPLLTPPHARALEAAAVKDKGSSESDAEPAKEDVVAVGPVQLGYAPDHP